jgi:hypothetical protein
LIKHVTVRPRSVTVVAGYRDWASNALLKLECTRRREVTGGWSRVKRPAPPPHDEKFDAFARPSAQPAPAEEASQPQRYDDPPWPRVVWTSLRVVAQRRLGSRRGRRIVFGLAAVLVLATAGVGYVLLTPDSTPSRPADVGSPAASPDPIAEADTTRALAATWVVENVAEGTIVACDPATCADLESSGYLATALVPLRDGADLRQAELVLVTSTVRARLGTTLDQLAAPTPLAVFGTPDAVVEVREISLDGPDGYQERWAADRTDRLSAGRALARARGLHLSRPARAHLLRGDVDTRILTTLPPLLAAHDLWISRFTTSGPEGSRGVLRIVEIDRIDGRKVGDGAGPAAAAVAYFRTQRPPFLPSTVEVSPEVQGIVLRVTYPVPSPLGLLGAKTN